MHLSAIDHEQNRVSLIGIPRISTLVEGKPSPWKRKYILPIVLYCCNIDVKLQLCGPSLISNEMQCPYHMQLAYFLLENHCLYAIECESNPHLVNARDKLFKDQGKQCWVQQVSLLYS